MSLPGFSNIMTSGGTASNLTGVPTHTNQLPGFDFMSMYGNPAGGANPLGGTNWQGIFGNVSAGLGAFSSLAQLYGGFKALNLQKDQFKFQKEAWWKNYNNQAKDYENRLLDQHEARSAGAAARGGDYGSLASYVEPRKLTGTYG